MNTTITTRLTMAMRWWRKRRSAWTRSRRRLRSCVERWPECIDGEYNPADFERVLEPVVGRAGAEEVARLVRLTAAHDPAPGDPMRGMRRAAESTV